MRNREVHKKFVTVPVFQATSPALVHFVAHLARPGARSAPAAATREKRAPAPGFSGTSALDAVLLTRWYGIGLPVEFDCLGRVELLSRRRLAARRLGHDDLAHEVDDGALRVDVRCSERLSG